MEIRTRQFGFMEIDEKQVYTMPCGMPGFRNMKRFAFIERKEIWPFICFQSLDDADLSFYIMNPALFMPDYRLDMDTAIREAGWEGDGAEDVSLYVIVNTSAGVPEKITANLIGPLVLNARRREADQLVLHNSPYTHQHLIFSQSSSAKMTKPPRKRVEDSGHQAVSA